MKKKMFVVGIIALTLAMTAAVLYAQESVAGKWVMSVQELSLQMVLFQDGEKISGTLESPHGEIRLTGQFSKGKLTIAGEPDSHAMQLSGSAVLLSDGSLSGNLSANLMEMKFTAIRKPAQ